LVYAKRSKKRELSSFAKNREKKQAHTQYNSFRHTGGLEVPVLLTVRLIVVIDLEDGWLLHDGKVGGFELFGEALSALRIDILLQPVLKEGQTARQYAVIC
jgi:hypothetical protein